MQVCILFSVLSLLIAANGLFTDPTLTSQIPNINQLLQINGNQIDHTQMSKIAPALVLALVFGIFGLIEVVLLLVAETLALGRSLVAKTRLNELLDVPGQTKPSINHQNITDDLKLVLQNVCAKQTKAVFGIEKINAVFDTQKPNLIMGASGAGKSTLLSVLAGELPPESGDIWLNDVNYLDVEFEQSLGFLGQTVDIFDQTLADNLKLGKAFATDDELLCVLEQVDLLDWVKNQPKGLNTPLGEYGMAISGGQARRIALARLLLNPKKILLLDEPFAGLDDKTRQIVWQSLNTKQQKGEIGILIIATHQVTEQMKNAQVLTI